MVSRTPRIRMLAAASCPFFPLLHDPLIRKHRPDQIQIPHLSRLRIHGLGTALQQLVDFVVAHLLAQIRQDVAQLAHADVAGQVLVEDLEAPRVLFRVAGIAEAVGAVEEGVEGWEVDCRESVSGGRE